MIKFPFPILTSSGDISDGFLVRCPSKIKKLSLFHVKKHYLPLLKIQKPVIDPFGFTVFPLNYGKIPLLICGIRIDGTFDRKKSKKHIGMEFNPVFPLSLFLDVINKFKTTDHEVKSQDSHVLATELNAFAEFVAHEIRKLNLQVKAQAETINMLVDSDRFDSQAVADTARSIFATSSLISVRLDAYDFQINPDRFSQGPKDEMTIYKKFDKTKKCLQTLCAKEHKKIIFSGESHDTILAYEILELLPFVLLENAIKYSPQQQEIDVVFTTENGSLKMSISSIGPILKSDEKTHVFERGFRGVNARAMQKSGTGTGLYFAKCVCDMHDIKISVDSDQKALFRLDNVPYSKFYLMLEFPARDFKKK